MKKRALSFFLVIIMTLTLFPWSVSSVIAADVTSGTFGADGDNLTWSFDPETGVLTISGEGNMGDPYPWYNYMNGIETVVIDDGVTDIGANMFFWHPYIKSVRIPDSVTSIKESAFAICGYLSDITIPSGVTSIERGAFAGCRSIERITIPDGITRIESGTFSACESLKNITIPKSITSIADSAFYGCKNIENIAIPDGVTRIERLTFYLCSSLSSITIPGSVTSIDEKAFQYCNSLKTVYFEGTADQWNSIAIGVDNDCLKNVNVVFIAPGDIDGNGVINANDIRCFRFFVSGASEYVAGVQQLSLDLNGDGVVNAVDYLVLKKLIAS